MTSFPPPKLQYKLAVVDIQENRLSKIALWRSCMMIGCVFSLGLFSVLPLGKITKPSQIKIEGERLVGTQAIHNALRFPYPQSVWTTEVSGLTHKLESIPSVEAANIKRQLIPPRLIVSVEERTPIAIATLEGEMGFLDIDGTWVSQDFYPNIDRHFTLPKILVQNYQNQYQKAWITLYQLITLYPELKITEVQWNHGGNLFLQTKIGRVLLGTNLLRLEQQFEIMLKLQNLNNKVEHKKIAYIDLSNPDVNLIQRY